MSSPQNKLTKCDSSYSQVDQNQQCFICTDPSTGASTFCTLSLLQALGINLQVTDNIYKFSVPDGITFDSQRLSNAYDMFNQQLPTGSLTGYISDLLGNLSTQLSNNLKQTLGIILGTIFIVIFLLFTVICVLLMAYGLINVFVGIVLIFIALFICTLALIISFNEAYNLGINLENNLFDEIDPILGNFGCALLSSVCCYSGLPCMCPNGACVSCKNPPLG